jgi:hypothetical protein
METSPSITTPLGRMVSSLRAFFARPGIRMTLLVFYYLAIIAGLIVLYGKGDFSTPPFVYQGF